MRFWAVMGDGYLAMDSFVLEQLSTDRASNSWICTTYIVRLIVTFVTIQQHMHGFAMNMNIVRPIEFSVRLMELLVSLKGIGRG